MRLITVILMMLALAVPALANPLDASRILRKQAAELEASGDLHGASKAFKAALVIQPGHPLILLNLVLLAEQSGDRVSAISRLNQFANAGLYFSPERLARG